MRYEYVNRNFRWFLDQSTRGIHEVLHTFTRQKLSSTSTVLDLTGNCYIKHLIENNIYKGEKPGAVLTTHPVFGEYVPGGISHVQFGC